MREEKGKGLNSRSCKKTEYIQQVEEFWMCITLFHATRVQGSVWICPSHPLFLLLYSQGEDWSSGVLCTPLQSSDPKDQSPLQAVISQVPFLACFF